MNILIVGGTGVLSSAVTAEALHQGISVTMINRGRRIIPNDVELIKANKDNYSTIAQELGDRQFDAVMDFLCYTDEQTENSVRFYSKYTKQYFYISSCAVYDTASLKGQIAVEDSKKVLPVWKYSVDKWASEQKLTALLKDTDVRYTIIRPCVTYGDTRIPYGIMPPYGYHWTLCARMLSGKPVLTWNGGVNRCNMTRVEDFAVGVVGLIGNPKAYNEAFNVCGNEAPSFNDVLEEISRILDKKIIKVDVSSIFYAKEYPTKAGEILGGRSLDTINSNEKIKSVVPSFSQKVSLHEGLIKTIEAYKEQNYQKGIDWRFDAVTDRIISKWCYIHNEDKSKYNLGFVDYLGTATTDDKIAYWLEFHRNNLFIKTGLLAAKVIKRIKRTVFK